MTVYQKLAMARVEFQNLKVKMTGQNKFAGYQYYELSDILPVINQIGCTLNFLCEVSFGETLATLFFRDTEKPDSFILFTSPMSSASLKGCHEVQNLGAVETYLKRYLYQNCFEIVESDSLNSTHNPDNKPVQIQTVNPELEKAIVSLTEWLEADPKVFNDMQRIWAEKQIADKNLVGIKKAIEKAKDLAKEKLC